MTVRLPLALLAALLAAGPTLAQGQGSSQPDPVVARVNGSEVHRSDVIAARAGLPQQAQQMPFEQLYPLLLDSMVSNLVVAQAGRKAKLADDPEVKTRVVKAQDQIIEDIYL